MSVEEDRNSLFMMWRTARHEGDYLLCKEVMGDLLSTLPPENQYRRELSEKYNHLYAGLLERLAVSQESLLRCHRPSERLVWSMNQAELVLDFWGNVYDTFYHVFSTNSLLSSKG